MLMKFCLLDILLSKLVLVMETRQEFKFPPNKAEMFL